VPSLFVFGALQASVALPVDCDEPDPEEPEPEEPEPEEPEPEVELEVVEVGLPLLTVEFGDVLAEALGVDPEPPPQAESRSAIAARPQTAFNDLMGRLSSQG
jgi:hypothetical protein